MRSAMAWSLSVRPPSECVVSVSRTLFQPWTRMSGWWLASSARSATRLTHAIAPLKSSNSSSRTRVSPPSRHTASAAMRIVSLVPSATETLFALGVGDEVVAVTHECDHPLAVLNLPRVTRDVIGPGLAPDEIDRAVRELTQAGRSIYALDEERLRRLRPDLIVTQALCSVCAVSV